MQETDIVSDERLVQQVRALLVASVEMRAMLDRLEVSLCGVLQRSLNGHAVDVTDEAAQRILQRRMADAARRTPG
jgi:hypothetical protein